MSRRESRLLSIDQASWPIMGERETHVAYLDIMRMFSIFKFGRGLTEMVDGGP